MQLSSNAQHIWQLCADCGLSPRLRPYPAASGLQVNRKSQRPKRVLLIVAGPSRSLMLRQLEAPYVFAVAVSGVPPEKIGEAPDITKCSLLRMRSQTPHHHVLPALRWRSGVVGASCEKLVMESFLLLKGTPWSGNTSGVPRTSDNHTNLPEPTPSRRRVRA